MSALDDALESVVEYGTTAKKVDLQFNAVIELKLLRKENEQLKEGIKEAVNYAKELKEVDDLSFSCDRPDIDKWLERWGE